VGGGTAGFAHVGGAGAWLSGSRQVQRATAIAVGVLLSAGVTRVAVERRTGSDEHPVAMTAAVGVLADAQVAPAGNRSAPAAASRNRPRRLRFRPVAQPPARGWQFWSARIRGCESHGRPDAPPDYGAENPDTSASGAYQILDSTWAGRFGVTHASDATPAQQEQVAADEYRRGGTTAWAASAPCWRLMT
jgi:hypothetical protein